MENSERDGNTRPPDLPLEKYERHKYMKRSSTSLLIKEMFMLDTRLMYNMNSILYIGNRKSASFEDNFYNNIKNIIKTARPVW